MPPLFPPGPKRRVLFITDFHQDEKLFGVTDYARGKNWELISNMRFHGIFPSETEADGILVTAYGERVQRWLDGWQDTPIVHIGITPPRLQVPWVDVDHAEAGRLGARHLMELGHLHHAFYSLVNLDETTRIRSAFEAELKRAGLRRTRLDFEADHKSEALKIPREARLRWLADHLIALEKPLAVMTDDDRRSLEIVAACEMAGLRVPEDVAILGCENRPVEVNLSPVPLSSIDLNRRQTGRKAAEILERMMDGACEPPQSHTVPPRGVEGRASTATFVTSNPGITRAVLHIRTHYPEPLRLTSLARLAGMSERQFRTEFTRLTGRCPREEIFRARMAAVTRLLRDTDLKLEAIAVESGFGSAKKLCEYFNRAYGMTPHRWRLQHLSLPADESLGRHIA